MKIALCRVGDSWMEPTDRSDWLAKDEINARRNKFIAKLDDTPVVKKTLNLFFNDWLYVYTQQTLCG